ncbi:acid protease [Lactarius tabidus]
MKWHTGAGGPDHPDNACRRRCSPTLALAALPFLVAAAPLDGGPGSRISIGLAKHSGFLNTEGFVVLEKVQTTIWHSVAKIQRGIEASERNSRSAHASASRLNSKRFTVQFDTGSSDLVIPNTGCGPICNGRILYDPSVGSTSSDFGKNFQRQHGNGASVSGEQYTDTGTLGDFQVSAQLLCDSLSMYFLATGQRVGQSRHFGHGIQVDVSVRANPIPAPVLSFYFSPAGSELYLGSTSANLYVSPFTYILGHWKGKFDAISVNGMSVGIIHSSSSAIIDTGTMILVFDHTRSFVSLLHRLIDVWKVPCNFNTPISITFSGTEFQISASSFILGRPSGSGACIGGLARIIMILDVGAVFLQNVYSLFDFGNNQVGFASLAQLD